MLSFIVVNMHWVAGALAVLCACMAFMIYRRNRGKGKIFELEEIVTLDSRGWLVLAFVAAFGAVVMIGSSAAIGVDYWSGLAINADTTAGKIDPEKARGAFGFLEYATVGVISFIFLAVIFELFSDLGTPIASGFKERKKKLIPELVLAASVACIIMSLVTKWGYYDDKTHVREVEGARTRIDDDAWTTKRDEAQATIDALADTPGSAVADAREASAREQIETLKSQIADAERARDALPETHSTNRLEFQNSIDEKGRLLLQANAELAAVAAIRDAQTRLAAAQTARDEAVEHIKVLAENGNGDGSARTRAGDLLFVRVFRVGVHQFLCWLFPLVYFESVAAYRDQRKKEEANEKRRATNEAKRNTLDGEFVDVTPEADFDDMPRMLADGRPAPREETEEEELARLRREEALANDPRAARSPGYDRADEEAGTEEDFSDDQGDTRNE